MLCGIPNPRLLTPDQAGKLLRYPMLTALVQETRSPRRTALQGEKRSPTTPRIPLTSWHRGPPQVAGRSQRTAGVRGSRSGRAASDGPEPPYTCGVRPAIPGHRSRPPSPPGPTLRGPRGGLGADVHAPGGPDWQREGRRRRRRR